MMHIVETIRAAGADVAWNERPHAGIPAEILAWGNSADVRRAAAALGLDFCRRSDKVTDLGVDGYAVGSLVTEAGRASFTICRSAWEKI